MASKQENIVLDDESLFINDLRIFDKDIVSYFQDLKESDDLDRQLIDLIRIGTSVTRSVSTKENLDYVKESFENLDSNFKDQIDNVFGQNGQFSEIIKEHFGEKGKVINDMLNPDNEGTPLHTLKKVLTGELEKISAKLEYNRGLESGQQKGTQKGIDFENQCEQMLSHIADIHSDVLEHTGAAPGKITGSKRGDFVMMLGGINKKIVFEMKDRGNLGKKEIADEIKEAMENREAEYGIFVVKNKDALPKQIGWFNEYDGRYLVCALKDGDESVLEDQIIHVAYKWARARLSLGTNTAKKVDPLLIRNKISEIEAMIKDIKSVRRECTNIENASENIKNSTKNTEKEIRAKLKDIIESLEE